MAYKDKKAGVIFPTRNGTVVGSAQERKMLDKTGATGIHKSFITNADGSVTMCVTRDGMPNFETSPITNKAVPEHNITFAPCSDDFMLGFNYADKSDPTRYQKWPTIAYAKLKKDATAVETYSRRDFHPGSTTWVDTRTGSERKYTKTISWDCPYGGRGGSNNTQIPLAVPILLDRTSSDPDNVDYNAIPIAIAPDLRVGEAIPGMSPQTFTFNTSTNVRVGVGIASNIVNTDWYFGTQSDYCSVPNVAVMRNDYLAITGLYEDEVKLFTQTPLDLHIISAAAVVSDGSTIYRILGMASIPGNATVMLNVSPIVLYLKHLEVSGRVKLAVTVALPDYCFFMWQVPFINSSATEAIGIFCVNRDLRVPPRILRINMLDGTVTDDGPAGVGTYDNYVGTLACDYIGDTIVYGKKTQSVTTSGAAYTNLSTTLVASINLDGAVFDCGATVAETGSIVGSDKDNFMEYNSNIVEPLYIDLRFGNYVLAQYIRNDTAHDTSKQNGAAFDITSTETLTYVNKAIYVVGGVSHVVEVGKYTKIVSSVRSQPDNIISEFAIPRTKGELSTEACTYCRYYCVPYCQAYSRRGEMLVSIIGAWKAALYLDTTHSSADLSTFNALCTRSGATLINMGAYDGDAKWFYDPYIGKDGK